MARLAYCLVLISLCLLKPALAASHEIAPEAAPFGPTGQQALAKQLCQDTRKPRLCAKVVQGDKEALATMKPTTKAKVSIDLAKSIASRVGAFMQESINRNQDNDATKECMQGCKLNYEGVVKELDLAYITFVKNPQKAIENLKEVDNKVEVCGKSLKLAGSKGEVSPIAQTNKLIKDLVQVAKSISSKTQEH